MSTNPSLAMFCDAAGSCFDALYALAAEQGTDGQPAYTPSWGALFDITQCPTADLPYLGQYVGVSIPLTATDSAARQLILAEAGMARGTLGAIASAVTRNISTVWTPDTSYAEGVIVSYQATLGMSTYYLVATAYTSGATFGSADLDNTSVVDPATQFSILERTGLDGADAYQLMIVVNPAQLTPVDDTAALISDVNNTKPGGIVLSIVTSATPLVSEYTLDFSAIIVNLAIATLADVT